MGIYHRLYIIDISLKKYTIYNMSFVISKSETKDQKLPCHRHRISLLSKLKFVFIKLIKVQNLPKTFEIVPPLLFQAKIIKSSVPIQVI